MNLEQVTAKGFRSFKTEQTLDLKGVPAGLYHVAGKNGAGKSSLFEIVHWVIFGETSRKLRATAIGSWTVKKGCEASFVADGVTISRGWSPNYLRVDDEEVDQKQLESVLGMTAEVALNTFYFSQFSDFFLDLKPGPRMEIYSTVLGLDLWESKSDLARTLSRESELEVQRLEVKEAKLLERARTLRSVNYEAESKAWVKKQRRRANELAEAAERLTAEESEATGELEHWKRKDSDLNKQQDKVELRLAQARKKERAQLSTIAGKEAEQRQHTRMAKQLAEEMADFDKLAKGACPLCKQEVGVKHRKAHLAHLHSTREECLDLAAYAAGEVQALVKEGLSADCDTLEQELKDLQAERDEVRAKVRSAEQAHAKLQIELHLLTSELDKLSKEVNPFDALIEENKAEAAKAQRLAKAVSVQLQEQRQAKAGLEFWVKGFKDIRFQVLQESLTQLNAEVNECLHDLGLHDWQMEFTVEKESKSGNVRRGFMCAVQSPDAPESVPWEAWSGGETQRLRIAAQMGISNMISSRIGLYPDFEFWDEPSTWLNEDGIKDMLAILQERAHRYNRRILIADHRALGFNFDGTIQVTKTEKGTQLQPSWL